MAHPDWPPVVTPRDIATRLGITTQRPDKTIRDFLRSDPPISHIAYERWEFTPDQAEEIVQRWTHRESEG